MTNEHRIATLEGEVKSLSREFTKETKAIVKSIAKIYTLMEKLAAVEETWKATRCLDHDNGIKEMKREIIVMDKKIDSKWPMVLAAGASSVVSTVTVLGIVLTITKGI